MNQSSFWLSFWLSKLLIAVGPMLATVGITVDKNVFISVATSSVLTLAGTVWSYFTHKAALGQPAITPAVPAGVLRAFALIALACGGLTACDTYSANLTTTQGSPAATVDNPGSIAAGASITSTLTPVGVTVGSIDGNTLVLSDPALATGTDLATFKNTLAVQLQQKEKTYEQTIGVGLQTVIPLIKDAATAATALDSIAATWGLEPSNPAQHSAYTNIESDLSKASASTSLLQTFVNGLATTGATQ